MSIKWSMHYITTYTTIINWNPYVTLFASVFASFFRGTKRVRVCISLNICNNNNIIHYVVVRSVNRCL